MSVGKFDLRLWENKLSEALKVLTDHKISSFSMRTKIKYCIKKMNTILLVADKI